jgi:hypothetical protein
VKKAILLSFCILLLLACHQPQAFTFRSIENVALISTSNDSLGIQLNVGFNNPNNFRVELKKIEGEIFINGHFIGQYKLDTLLKIDKKSAFNIPAALTISKKILYQNAWNSLLQKEVMLEIKGFSKVGRSGIFIRLPFDYKGNQRIPFF